MSHFATNWAIQQRGLDAATKVLLWHLADCHDPAQGCFPTQAYLVDRSELSCASVNRHLAILEQRGLIFARCSIPTSRANCRLDIFLPAKPISTAIANGWPPRPGAA